MSPRYWSTLSLIVAVLVTVSLIGIEISLKLFDFSLITEFKALLTVIFSFAASCLLFVWLIQKGPLYASWPTLNVNGYNSPSLHPRGRIGSHSSNSANQTDALQSISFLVDPPPNYEDALNNSKPVHWNLSARKTLTNQPGYSSQGVIQTNNQSSSNTRLCQHLHSSSDCQMCLGLTTSDPAKFKNARSNSVAQLALSIVRGFTTIEPVASQQNDSHSNRRSLQENTHICTQERKPSFCQLDVSQLPICESPPKYCDLLFGNLANENTRTFSNESRAGDVEFV